MAAEGSGPAATGPDAPAHVQAWDVLIEDLLENALESWRARDLRGVVEVLGMLIRALNRRAHLT